MNLFFFALRVAYTEKLSQLLGAPVNDGFTPLFPYSPQELTVYTTIAVPSLGIRNPILYYSIDAPFTFYLPSLLLCTLARRSILPMNIHYAPASHHHVGNWTSSLRLFTQ